VTTGIRALLLPRYSQDAASSRYRFFEMVPAFEAAGISCTVAPFFDDGYIADRLKHPSTLAGSALRAYRRRWRVLRNLQAYDVALVQMELFPYAPWRVEERAMTTEVAWVVDYDDAWFHRYDDNRNPLVRLALKDKIGAIMKRATSVVAGSHYLLDYAGRFNQDLVWAPTSIDITRYPYTQPTTSDREFVIGWIGSPATSSYLSPLRSMLLEFCAARNARVVFMGAGDDAPSGSCITRIPWSAEGEVDEISRWHVGIMPLPDSPFARGKCAFKIIQYMGCWKPVVASPVGENSWVVEHGVNGFLANSMAEWTQALSQLYENRDAGSRMGFAGRARVEQNYSRQIVAPKVARCLADAVGRRDGKSSTTGGGSR